MVLAVPLVAWLRIRPLLVKTHLGVNATRMVLGTASRALQPSGRPRSALRRSQPATPLAGPVGTQPMICTSVQTSTPDMRAGLAAALRSVVTASRRRSRPHRAGASQAAPAQAPAPAAPEVGKAKLEEGKLRVAEEVTVTGTMIPRRDLTALSPVAVVNVEEVTYQGTGRVEDLIQQLPQAFAAQNASISNGASGTATVQLRNLGSVRTLSLLNGRRMASGDAYESAADLNFIPSSLVKRVDVLTGGASSVYGADAVAGVVNFVLDTEFQGFRGAVQWNGFQHNNNNSVAQDMNKASGFTAPTGSTWNNGGYNFDLAVGGKFGDGKGYASAFVDYRDISAIWKDQRDYTNCSVGLGDDGPDLQRLEHLAVRSFHRRFRRLLGPRPEDGQHGHVPQAQGLGRLQLRRHQLHAAQRPQVVRRRLRPLHVQQAGRALRRGHGDGRLLGRADRAVGRLRQHDRDQLRQPDAQRPAARRHLHAERLRTERRRDPARHAPQRRGRAPGSTSSVT